MLKKINGKGKPFIIHKNRIKIFFGHFMENVEENEPPQTQNRPPESIGDASGEDQPRKKRKSLPKPVIKKTKHLQIPVRIQPTRQSKLTYVAYNLAQFCRLIMAP